MIEYGWLFVLLSAVVFTCSSQLLLIMSDDKNRGVLAVLARAHSGRILTALGGLFIGLLLYWISLYVGWRVLAAIMLAGASALAGCCGATVTWEVLVVGRYGCLRWFSLIVFWVGMVVSASVAIRILKGV